MWQWADAHGFDMNVVSEHHGVDDGWIPAPLTVVALGLARTQRIPFFVSACLLPLHDPVRIAEQIAVLDCAAPGRLITVFGAGYRVEEFEMAGVAHKERTKVLEEYVGVVVRALTEERFEWRGRTISVTPRPVTQPHPMIMVGGGVPAAARRAARLRLPMMPMNADPELPQAYAEEAAKVGYTGGFVTHPDGPTFVHVTDDPERAWAEIGAVPALRDADVRVVPDAGPALDARRARRRPRRPAQGRGHDLGRHARGHPRPGRGEPGAGDQLPSARGWLAAGSGVAEPRALRVRRGARTSRG